MSTKTILLISFIILIFLPLLWTIMKVFGFDSALLLNFWHDFGIWAIGFAVLIGGYILITKLKKK
jgi:hypothetical protein